MTQVCEFCRDLWPCAGELFPDHPSVVAEKGRHKMSTEQEPGAVETRYRLSLPATRAWSAREIENLDYFRAHDAEGARSFMRSRQLGTKLHKAETKLAEREALLARLVEALKAGRGTHGELCSDWENCQFVREADAALAAARAVAP